MLTTQEIRRRIRSISSTAQITRAMQMVAASKMRKAQQAALSARPFSHLLYRMQRMATSRAVNFSDPLLEVREVRRRAVILIGADKGLCGSLNSNLFRVATQFDTDSTVFITAGRRAAQFVARSGRQLAAEFTYGDPPHFPEARAIAACASDMFRKGEVDQVQVVATRYVNTLTQQAVALQFLPIGEITGLPTEEFPSDEALIGQVTEMMFEPNAGALLGYLLSRYLNIYIYLVMLNARASEHSARMVSMKSATDNADDLIKELNLEYNKLRQGNITKELLDIAGGQADSA